MKRKFSSHISCHLSLCHIDKASTSLTSASFGTLAMAFQPVRRRALGKRGIGWGFFTGTRAE